MTYKNYGSADSDYKGMFPHPFDDRDNVHSSPLRVTSPSFCRPSLVKFKLQGGTSPTDNSYLDAFTGVVVLRNGAIEAQASMPKDEGEWASFTIPLESTEDDEGVYTIQLRDGKTGIWSHIELS